MSEINAALGDSGARHSIEWRGRTIVAKNITIKSLEDYSLWAYNQAKKILREDREDLGEERFIERLDKLRAAYQAKAFDISNPAIQASMGTLDGGCKLVSIILSLSDEESFAIMQEMSEEVTDLLSTIKRNSFGSDPKAPAPA